MKRLSKVVWKEGMYLAPHHFQTQGRFFEDLVDFTMSALRFKPYGLCAAEFDMDALANGIVLPRRLSGVFPDGLPFDCPGSDPNPEPLVLLNRFPTSKAQEVVCLAVPRRTETGSDFAKGANGSARFRPVGQTVRDETNGTDERMVEVGQKNLRLLLEPEVEPSDAVLPLVRVQRTGSGGYAFDPMFMPTSLEIAGSPAMLDCVRRVMELLEEQSGALAVGKGSGLFSLADAYRATPDRFWLLHAIHSAMAPLRHLLGNPQAHPEELYRELARLAGALSTFTLEGSPSEIPLYDHDQPELCFLELERLIRTSVRTIRPQNFLRFPLQRGATGIFTASLEDARCYQRSRWLLGIRCASGEAKTIREIPVQAKVCSEEFVPRLVQRAIPGMELTHLPAAPPGFAPQFDFEYFSIGLRGPCWEHLMKIRRIGLWVPEEFGETQAEIVVLLEG
jgi:type VI secretion system protein ImpJ